jgi:hypothetical protein
VEGDDIGLKLSGEIMPDVRQSNRWCLCVKRAWPSQRPPEGYRGGSKEVMWALLMGVIHDRDNFFSLHCYQNSEEWQYAEITKRLQMLATLIYAEYVKGKYIK